MGYPTIAYTNGALSLIAKLCPPSVVKAGEACLTSVVTSANEIQAANTTARRPTLRKPLTKLLGRRGLAPTLLLLPLVTTRTSPLNSSTLTATTAAATTPTAATTATTAAIESPTPATTPTATSTASTASTPAATATTLASLALAAAALPTKSRSSPDVLSTKDVNSSSRSVGGGKGGGGTPLKEGTRNGRAVRNRTDREHRRSSSCLAEHIAPVRRDPQRMLRDGRRPRGNSRRRRRPATTRRRLVFRANGDDRRLPRRQHEPRLKGHLRRGRHAERRAARRHDPHMTRAHAFHSPAPFILHSIHSLSPPVVSPPTVLVFPVEKQE
ncbi:unnamed protein product [Closterium sp. NIES-53]